MLFKVIAVVGQAEGVGRVDMPVEAALAADAEDFMAEWVDVQVEGAAVSPDISILPNSSTKPS